MPPSPTEPKQGGRLPYPGKWWKHVGAHNIDILIHLQRHMLELEAAAGWRYCVVCCVTRNTGREGALNNKREAFLRKLALLKAPADPTPTQRPSRQPKKKFECAEQERGNAISKNARTSGTPSLNKTAPRRSQRKSYRQSFSPVGL